MILLVITFKKIPLSLPIALIYYFVSDGSPFQYTKPHLSICWKSTLFYHIAEMFSAVISIVILLSSYLLGNNFL